MKLWVGLGNPEPEHAGQRHNIGFMAIDAIARRYDFSSWRNQFEGSVSEGFIGGQPILALKPLTYMNYSGESVREIADFYRISPEDITVFQDDIDLAPGYVQIKYGGGSGGHNGLRSINLCLEAQNYYRVRLGVGRPATKKNVINYVLGEFSDAEQKWLKKMLAAIADTAPVLATGQHKLCLEKIELAMQNVS